MDIMKIDHVSKHFGRKQVLADVSFELAPNKIYALLGRNGAGKSTLMSIMIDALRANSGSVKMGGKKINDNDDLLGKMYLMSSESALDNVMFQRYLKLKNIFQSNEALYGGFDWQTAQKLVNEFGLSLDVAYFKLSTGQKTLAKLVLALCLPVDYVFLDEPVLGLDANHRDMFYQELLKSYENRPRTFVISTHLIEEIDQIVEHVLTLDKGKIIVDDTTEHLLDQSFLVSGPQKAVSGYTQGLNVIHSRTLANIKYDYVFGQLNDQRAIPDTVKVEHYDLQHLFMYLTHDRGIENA
ncbi:MAG TPA: ABC transporter ATP-binding protein [Candidatus Limosilactobacillus merdipullorum]|uniref:ABC transporter ATP-binding protein n=1 Tax=Candidatus Limosilactobacillus merdipullorum TaxID=2838653 RepID=A0A9D1QN91_9LACO|nr:ABC transporter ATP-binding protein [Candidatus Limosilactobacillus merdipullorum]